MTSRTTYSYPLPHKKFIDGEKLRPMLACVETLQSPSLVQVKPRKVLIRLTEKKLKSGVKHIKSFNQASCHRGRLTHIEHKTRSTYLWLSATLS